MSPRLYDDRTPNLFDERLPSSPSSDPRPNSPADVGYVPASLRRAQTFPIPPSAPARPCRSCRATIYWVLTARGKNMPVNPDGTSHFANCPNARDHRRR